jgi:ribose/xylose/arabinose/galactoside ABC-type transport system permease subunit
MAGVFLVSRLASAEATSGQGIELDVITAVLLGGSSIAGGSGGLGGTVLGLLIIAVLRNGLDMMGVSVLFQNVILGVLILIAVGRQKR